MPIQKLPGSAIAPGTITVVQLESTVATTVQTGGGPKITTVQVTSNSYVVLDDTAVDIAGGYIKITGTGFAAGCQVLINNTPATSTTFIGPTEVRAQLPATAAGTYMLYVINADGGVAIRVNGVTFSAAPSWVTASDLSGYSLGDAISIQLAATGANTFALAAGSTLPTGLTLSAGGLLSGSVTGLENDTSYSFTITATDAENQDSPRTFSITITVQLQVSRSLRFNYAARTTGLSRIFSQDGNRKTYTLSMWVKRSTLAVTQTLFSYSVSGDDNGWLTLWFTDDDKLRFQNWNSWYFISNMLFRDPASWYHLLLVVDTTQAVTTDRIKIYVNGSIITYTNSITFSLNQNTFINSANVHYIGRSLFDVKGHNGYMTEIHFIDGQALTPSAFAETNNLTGQYIPKKYTGTYGTNGFYLPFTDNSSVLNLGRNYQPLTADPFWNRTVLLLNGTGTNNAQNNTFTDSSTNAFAITRNGNVSQGRFSPFSQGGYSFSTTATNTFDLPGSVLAFGSSSFTLEAWLYMTHASGGPIVYPYDSGNAFTNAGFSIGIGTTGSSYYAVNGATPINYGGTFYLSTWYHLALVKDGTAARLYIDGKLVATGTDSTTYSTPTGGARIGGIYNLTQTYGLVVNNLRIVTGQALYNSNFTPANTNLTAGFIGHQGLESTAITGTVRVLTARDPYRIDRSSNNHTIGASGSPQIVPLSPFTANVAYSAAANGGSAYFDGTGDYLQAAITALTGQFTVEFWFYRPSTGNNFMFTIGDSFTNTGAEVYIGTNGTVLNYYSNGNARITATPPNAGTWSYIAVSRDASNVVRLYVDGTQVGGTYTQAATLDTTLRVGAEYYNAAITGTATGYISGFRVSNTARTITVPTQPLVNDANTVCLLNFTNAAIVDATGDNNIETVSDAKISTAQSKWAGSSMAFDGTGDYLTIADSPVLELGTGDFTIEAWIYPTLITGSNRAIFGHGTDSSNWWGFYLQSTGILEFAAVSGNSVVVDRISSNSVSLNTWTHVAVTRNGSTFKLWIGGSEPPSYTGSPSTTSSAMTDWSSAFWIGGPRWTGGSSDFVGYIQDVRITRAARYTGNFTPPTTQFAYNQGDINYNQWVPTNFSVTAGTGNDSVVDSPTNWGVDTGLGGEVRGNYCTLNPNIPPKNSGSASRTLANGNLDLAGVSGGWTVAGGTFRIFAGSGRWYFETTGGAASSTVVGFHKLTRGYFLDAILGYTDGADTEGYAYAMDGNKLNNGGSAYGASWTTSDVIGCAIDASAATASITFYKNGVSQGVAFSNLTGDFIPAVSIGGTGPVVCNFGQRPFAYAAPSGFKSLNTHNLPALAVTKSNTAFDTLLYTGTGSALTVGGYNFSPDIVWYKSRSSGVYYHGVFDTVRGATKFLATNDPGVEVTDSARLSAFTANGFTAGTDVGINTSGANMVAWAWDAGTTTVVNTAGTIQSNVRVNAAAGISIVSYTGTQATATVGHGLGTAPKLIIAKSRSVSNTNWVMYHNSLGSTNSLLILNLANATTTITNYWGSAVPTSTVFGVANGVYDNNNGSMIAYCFAEVSGFSSFGGWTGNGSADGPFIYTGFRPAMILAKQTNTSGQNWYILDSDRSPSNVLNRRLYPNLTNSEDTDGNINCDLLSNGFKLRDSYTGWNANGGTYIYAAFAESPFKYARAR